MDENFLPIDIHVTKLLEWLITRRHCNKDSQVNLDKIREKLKISIQDMPVNEKIGRILAGTQLNYYNCLQILEILKETESDSKNIFGFYSSQRIKDWKEIISLYEKDNVYLIESALIMTRNVSYEIPSLRKQISRLDATEEEFLKKSKDFIKQSNTIKSDYYNFAKKMGIEGENIINELGQIVEDFPKYLDQILIEVPKLSEPFEYYNEFLQVVHKRNDIKCVPILKCLLQIGNVTYFQFRTGQVPQVVEKPTLELPTVKLDQEMDKKIDFGDIAELVDDTGSSSTTNGNSDFVHINKDDCMHEEVEINWDIEAVEDSPEVLSEEKSDDQLVASGNDALTLLEYQATFKNFINELYELEGFFDQRLYELKHDTNLLSSNQLLGGSSRLQLTTADKLTIMLEDIRKVLSIMTNDKVKMILTIKENPKYALVVEKKLNSKLSMINKALEKSKLMEEKAHEARVKSDNLKLQIPVLVEKTREIQKLVEADISKRYKNRPVNIMGAIQILDLV